MPVSKKATLKSIRKADQARPKNVARRIRSKGANDVKSYNTAYKSEIDSPKYDKEWNASNGMLSKSGQKVISKAHKATEKKLGYTYQDAVSRSYTKASSIRKSKKK